MLTSRFDCTIRDGDKCSITKYAFQVYITFIHHRHRYIKIRNFTQTSDRWRTKIIYLFIQSLQDCHSSVSSADLYIRTYMLIICNLKNGFISFFQREKTNPNKLDKCRMSVLGTIYVREQNKP